MYPPEKKNVLEQAAFWHEVKVGQRFSTASKSCPDASVEIALTFSLRNTRDIPSRSNSKRLASTAELKIALASAISEFRIILSRSLCTDFPLPDYLSRRCMQTNIDLHLIDRHQSIFPKPHQSGAPFASVQSFPEEQ